MSKGDTPPRDDGGDEALDRIQFLVRADSRARVVEYLGAVGSATRDDVRRELDASRTTVVRALQALEDRGWVEDDNGDYRLTRVGTVIAGEFTNFLETVRRVEKLADFLRWFPTDEREVKFVGLRDAEITTSSEGDPYAPARKQTEILRTADRIRILLPSIDLEGTKTIRERVTEHGMEAETVISPELEGTLESAEFAPLLSEKLRTGRSTVFVARGELPFYLGLADDGRVQIGVEDGEGFPRALLETTDDDVRAWAEGVYRRYREEARRKPVGEFE